MNLQGDRVRFSDLAGRGVVPQLLGNLVSALPSRDAAPRRDPETIRT